MTSRSTVGRENPGLRGLEKKIISQAGSGQSGNRDDLAGLRKTAASERGLR
jgi:hypothetical protein